MKIVVHTVRHQHAPIDIRENLAISESEREAALQYLNQQPGITGAVILSTCNRSEVYCIADSLTHSRQAVEHYFLHIKHLQPESFQPFMTSLMNDDAVLHLFQVASGLDSLIIGEGQILNQMKEAFQYSKESGTSHVWLDRLAQHALTTGKRVRTETGISRKDVSVSRAAYDRIKQLDPDFLSKRIALIGGGKMATMVMQSLNKALPADKRAHISLINRSEVRLNELTEKFGFTGYTWACVNDVLAQSDILFVATGAPHILLRSEQFEGISHSQLIMDVSVPRNVCPSVGKLPHVQLFNTDDLRDDSPLEQDEQTNLLAQAQLIINDEFKGFYQWFSSLPAIPTISTLRHKVESIRKKQVLDVSHGSEHEEQSLHSLSKKLVNKILHDPLVKLREENNAESLSRKINLLKELFNLPADTIDPSPTQPLHHPSSLVQHPTPPPQTVVS